MLFNTSDFVGSDSASATLSVIISLLVTRPYDSVWLLPCVSLCEPSSTRDACCSGICVSLPPGIPSRAGAAANCASAFLSVPRAVVESDGRVVSDSDSASSLQGDGDSLEGGASS